MEKVDIKICVRPYVHDIIDEISRKPKFISGKHYIQYKNKRHLLTKTSVGCVVWVDDE
ncbi:MAG: hypothetical protein KQ78_01484 [Candidatus Izimaplasma bacterium HR2]|nr:MAG: hypothetical protein KQ78_01484 [Candidatus Izimaplasma bacterium HR2]